MRRRSSLKSAESTPKIDSERSQAIPRADGFMWGIAEAVADFAIQRISPLEF